jgi:thiosulfate/3-mercaptopyruvate sulfurtransferase
MTSPLITTETLAARLGAAGLVVLDCSWYLPAQARDPKAEYAQRHIPGAVFFDIDAVADHASSLPHMLPSPQEFATHVRRMGVEPDSHVVTYDAGGLAPSARVWWTFRAMGHEAVQVLDGGLGKWLADGRAVETGWPEPPPHGEFKAHPNPTLVRDLGAVRAALAAGDQVLDARPAERFRGDAPEPRAGLRSGHMPGARNLPWGSLVQADGTLLPPDRLRAALDAAGIDLTRPVTTSCGSGVTASGLALALAVAGRDDAVVYDGSWAEWGARADTEVVTGPA